MSQHLRIVSCWKMLHINSEAYHALGFIASSRAEWRLWCQILPRASEWGIAPLDIPMESRAHFLKSCEVLKEVATVLGLTATNAAAERAFDHCLQALASPIRYDHCRLSRVVNLAEQLIQVFGDEMNGRRIMTMSARHGHLYDELPSSAKLLTINFPLPLSISQRLGSALRLADGLQA